MPLPKYIVRLSAEERTELDDLIRTGKRAASAILHARILLKADAGADGPGTHKPAALCEAFEPTLARSLVERLEIHYTPKHGSWLNVAEIELSVLSRQCLDHRIPDADTLTHKVAAWEQACNADPRPVNWRFTTPDARIKLKRLYPSIQSG